jgi:two-component system, NtrC family, response regulator AtoC
VPLTMDLKRAMVTYRWPGNVRELENLVRRLIVLRDPEMVARELHAKSLRQPTLPSMANPPATAEACPGAGNEFDSTPILEQVIKAKQQAETEAILAALNSTRWNRKQAAALLKIDYKALLYKMKKLGVEDDKVSGPAAPTDKRLRTMSATGD